MVSIRSVYIQKLLDTIL